MSEQSMLDMLPPMQPPPPQLQPPVALVIAGAPDLQLLLDELSAAGFTTHTAHTEAEGIEKHRALGPDLTILSLRLSSHGGLDACRQLCELNSEGNAAILVVGQLDQMETVEAACEAGATDFTITPIDARALKLRVSNAMRALRTAHDLRRSMADKRALLDAFPDLMWRIHKDGRLLDFEDGATFKDWAPKKPRQVGKHFTLTLPDGIMEDCIKTGIRAFETGEVQFLEFQAVDGDETYFRELRTVPCGPDELLAVVRDITQRKQTEMALVEKTRQLAESEASYRDQTNVLQSILKSMGDGVVVMDKEGRCLLSNPAAERLLDLNGRPAPLSEWPEAYGLRAPDTGKPFAPWQLPMYAALSGQAIDGAEVVVDPEARRSVWLSVNARPLAGEDGGIMGCVSVIRDITDKKENEQRILHLAQYDQLTGLPNRTLFRDRLEQALRRSERSGKMAGLMFLDLDKFKEINDTLGHAAGDQALRIAAERMNQCLRQTDTLSRIAGDEFTVVIEDATLPYHAELVAERIVRSLCKPFHIDGREMSLSVSVGIALYPMDADSTEELLKKADMAMYQVKKTGRNGFLLYRDVAAGMPGEVMDT